MRGFCFFTDIRYKTCLLNLVRHIGRRRLRSFCFLCYRSLQTTCSQTGSRSDGQGETKENSQQIIHAGSTCFGTIIFCRTSLYGSSCNYVCVRHQSAIVSVNDLQGNGNYLSKLLLFTDFMKIASMKDSKICHVVLLYKMTVSNEKFHISVRKKTIFYHR